MANTSEAGRSLKCARCAAVSYDHAQWCRRCGAVLDWGAAFGRARGGARRFVHPGVRVALWALGLVAAVAVLAAGGAFLHDLGQARAEQVALEQARTAHVRHEAAAQLAERMRARGLDVTLETRGPYETELVIMGRVGAENLALAPEEREVYTRLGFTKVTLVDTPSGRAHTETLRGD